MDFEQAYDRIIRVRLWEPMEEFGIPHKLIRLCSACLERAKSCVKIVGEYSQTFFVNKSLKLGDALSPVLFNFAPEKAERQASISSKFLVHVALSL